MVLLKQNTSTTSLTYSLDSVTVSVSSQKQTDSIYFDINQAFDKVCMLFYYINLITVDSQNIKLPNSKVIYHPDFPLLAL
jgi:hypothetical protein